MADEQEKPPAPMQWRPIDIASTDAANVRPIYADTTFVNRTADDVTIAFFLTKRPPLTEEQINELKAWPADCVARIILPPRAAQALGELLKRFSEETPKEE
jgi:hypothetical protein